MVVGGCVLEVVTCIPLVEIYSGVVVRTMSGLMTDGLLIVTLRLKFVIGVTDEITILAVSLISC